MKKIVSILLIFTMLFVSTGIYGSGNKGSVYSQQKKISIGKGTRKVNVVSVDLNSPKIKLEVVTAKDRIGTNEPFKDIIKRTKAKAAINCNYFDAYRTLVPYGTIAKEGKIVYLEGNNPSMAIKNDNSVEFARVTTTISGGINDKFENYWDTKKNQMSYNAFKVWYVNSKPTDKSGVYIFTKEKGDSVELNGGIAITVKQDKVTTITYNSKKVNIPKDGYLIYYGNTKDFKEYVDARFKVGDKVTLKYENSSETYNSFTWDDVRGLISAGPYLVHNGQYVVNKDKQYYKEAKIIKNRAGRSAIGVTKDNTLLMVTVGNVNIHELAVIMKSLGAVEAINLDGGASSALYCKGKYIQTPGRKLSTVLVVK